MALKILSVDNGPTQDGLNLRVQLDQAPTGTLAFYAHPIPGRLLPTPAGGLVKTSVAQGGNAYNVKVRAGAPTEPALLHRMPFWVVAHDNNGYSNLHGDWLCAGANSDWLQQVNDVLQDTLDANIGLLDRAMQIWRADAEWPSGEPLLVEKIHRGQPQQAATFPNVCHNAYSIDEDYQGLGNMEAGRPYSWLVPIKSKIQAYSLWQEDLNWDGPLVALGMGVFNLLNQPCYTRFTLASNLDIFSCMCTGGVLQEYFDASLDAWVIGFEMTWQAQLHAGKYDPNIYLPVGAGV